MERSGQDKTAVAPDGTVYRIPRVEEAVAHFAEVERRARGRRVVVVQGLGFVGAAVAAVIASARDAAGEPRYFVIGVDLATPGSFWKIGKLNEGLPPITSPDAELDRLIAQAVNEAGNLCVTSLGQAYALAEVIVVDVQLDVVDRTVDTPDNIELDLAGFTAAIRAVGRTMRPDALVLVETTVPFGACEKVVLPALAEERARRGIHEPVLLAHAYERVMPGRRYVDSIRRFWRTFAGVDVASAEKARAFLDSFIDTAAFPLAEFGDTTSSEFGKILENSYRAANIAFIHEWTLLAERSGVDLWAVVDAIRVRKGTHDNMRYPGFGVGGYCLTKDSLLAQWSARNFFESEHVLAVTFDALRINHQMPLHTLDLLRELFPGGFAGRTVAVCGLSYLPDVADTRNSPTELFVDALAETGARVLVHDPCVQHWLERPAMELTSDLSRSLAEADAVVFAVPHSCYKALQPAGFAKPLAIVDASNVIPDASAEVLHRAGRRLLGVGKGHWRKRGYHLFS